jgi:hypothetical protein
MHYHAAIRSGDGDPRQLEELYRRAQADGAEAEFGAAIDACWREAPDNALYAAWHYRLQPLEEPRAPDRPINWKVAIPIALVTAVLCAILSLPPLDFADGMPNVFLTWSVVGGAAVIAYLAIAGDNHHALVPPLLGLLVAGAYVALLTLGAQRAGYRTLMMIHLPLLAMTAVAVKVLAGRRDLAERFAFILKAIEVCVVGGVYVVVGGVFAVITFGLFQAIGIQPPEFLQRLLVAAGGGAITVLAVATVYDPRLGPAVQRLQQGLGRIVPTMFRLLLPLALGVLVIYLFVIPFNFMVPFGSREVLIVYNVMLFGVVGLLLGTTPLRAEDLAARHHRLLRTGYVAVAALAVVISIYALSATVYRTALGGITLNRLTVIGWNLINIGLLVLLIVRAVRRPAEWVPAVQSAFTLGAVVYVAWTLVLVVATPWIFP